LQADVPVQVAGMETVWTILYTLPSRYNWLFQFYLRDQGVALSWVGSGRMIFSLNISDDDFEIFIQRFVMAAQQMQKDGWFWMNIDQTNRRIKRNLLKEMALKKWTKDQCTDVRT
jgi:glutamate-1-semialdehyde 2,1-aminomutase